MSNSNGQNLESNGGKMKPEVQSSALELPEV